MQNVTTWYKQSEEGEMEIREVKADKNAILSFYFLPLSKKSMIDTVC